MQKTWTLQLIGLLIIALLLIFALPRFADRLPNIIAEQAQQHLHSQGFTWSHVKSNGNRDVLISGETSNAEQQKQAVQTAQALWYVQNVENAIKPPIVEPYTLHLVWNGKQLTANGYVTDKKTKNELANHLKNGFDDHDLSKLETGSGAPANWSSMIKTVLKSIKPMQTASVRIIDKDIHIAGKTATSTDIQTLETSLKAVEDQGYSAKTRIMSMDAAAIVCQKEFNDLLSQEKILFKSGGSSIDSKSNDLLQKLADAAVFCADWDILITGHTDDIGSDEDNQKLIEQRAKSVKGWLFNQGGIPLERLTTEGKGAIESLADNDTEEGRSKNRRIEFTVEGI